MVIPGITTKVRTKIGSTKLQTNYFRVFCFFNCQTPDGISVPRPGRIPPCSAEDVRASYTWRYSDIDINRHVNSVRYIETMLDIWPLEHYDTHRIAQLDIIYQHECLCGQTVAVAARDVAVTTHEIQQIPTSAPLQASDVELLRDGKRVCAAHIVWKEG